MIISIELIYDFLKISNGSDYDVMVSIKPIKPKRKFTDILLVPKGTFLVHELRDGKDIDLSKLSISFLKEESKTEPEVNELDTGLQDFEDYPDNSEN